MSILEAIKLDIYIKRFEVYRQCINRGKALMNCEFVEILSIKLKYKFRKFLAALVNSKFDMSNYKFEF